LNSIAHSTVISPFQNADSDCAKRIFGSPSIYAHSQVGSISYSITGTDDCAGLSVGRRENLGRRLLLGAYNEAFHSLSQYSYSNSRLISIPNLRGADLQLRDDFSESFEPLLQIVNACDFPRPARLLYRLQNRFIEFRMIVTEAAIPHSAHRLRIRIPAGAQRVGCIFDFAFASRKS
ncbi:hypothetical protein FOC1_g10001598, partial [Fusarium oxysporum f. sp. cubense race 1]